MSKPLHPEEIDMRPVSPEELGDFVGPQMATPASEIQPGMPLEQLTSSSSMTRIQHAQVKEFPGIKEEPNKEKGE